jgi:hypothetical protein
MKEEEIYVVIDSEEKRLRALDILETAGEKVYKSLEKIKHETKLRYDKKDLDWYLTFLDDTTEFTEITLDQLEQLLIPISELDQLKQQAELLGYELFEKKREIKVGDFGKFKDKGYEGEYLGFLKDIKYGLFYKVSNGKISEWDNFRHLTEEEKQHIQNNW